MIFRFLREINGPPVRPKEKSGAHYRTVSVTETLDSVWGEGIGRARQALMGLIKRLRRKTEIRASRSCRNCPGSRTEVVSPSFSGDWIKPANVEGPLTITKSSQYCKSRTSLHAWGGSVSGTDTPTIGTILRSRVPSALLIYLILGIEGEEKKSTSRLRAVSKLHWRIEHQIDSRSREWYTSHDLELLHSFP